MLVFPEGDSRVSHSPYLVPIFKGVRFALETCRDQKCVVVFWMPEILDKVYNSSPFTLLSWQRRLCNYLSKNIFKVSSLVSIKHGKQLLLHAKRTNSSVNQSIFYEIGSVNWPLLLTQDHHTSFDPSIRYKVITDEHIINIQFRLTPDLRLPFSLQVHHNSLNESQSKATKLSPSYEMLNNMRMLHSSIRATQSLCVHLYIEELEDVSGERTR